MKSENLQQTVSEQTAESGTSSQNFGNEMLPAVYVVIKCGYEEIDGLIYATTDGEKAAAKVKFLRADISAAKLEMDKVGEEKWKEMYDNDELDYGKYSMAKFEKEDAYCMQKFDGQRFDCCCKEFGVEPSETWLM